MQQPSQQLHINVSISSSCLHWLYNSYIRVCVCVCVCVRACVRECVRACVRACVCIAGDRVFTIVADKCYVQLTCKCNYNNTCIALQLVNTLVRRQLCTYQQFSLSLVPCVQSVLRRLMTQGTSCVSICLLYHCSCTGCNLFV